jgi:hypothetical protein
VALDQFRHKWEWNIDTNYTTILANLTQVNNPRACFLTRIQTIYAKKHSPWLCLDDLAHTADGGHNGHLIWSSYFSIGAMAMPRMMTQRGDT